MKTVSQEHNRIKPPLLDFNRQTVDAILKDTSALRIIPWVYKKVQQNKVSKLNPESLSVLKKTYSANLLKNTLLYDELQMLLRNLEKANIHTIPLKGPLLSLRIYGEVGIRPSADLDILTRPEDTVRAIKILEDAGYKNASEKPSSHHIKFRKSSETGNTFYLELHLSLIGVRMPGSSKCSPFGLFSAWEMTNAMWKNATPYSAVDGTICWQLTLHDEFLHLCLHLAQHLLMEAHSEFIEMPRHRHSLLLALDLDQIMNALGNRIDWDRFIQQMAHFQLQRPVGLALAFTRKWFVTSLPDKVLAAAQLPDWQRTWYFSNVTTHIGVKSRFSWAPRHLKYSLDYLMMANCWKDRLFLPFVSMSVIGRRLKNSNRKKAS